MLNKKRITLGIFITVATFWLSDSVLHFTGVGETNYYYLSKFANSVLFSFIWFAALNYKQHWKKALYSLIFATWVSFYYLISSYSGLVQFLFGVYARYTAPPFVIFGVFLTPYLWWLFHALMFYLGLELSGAIAPVTSKKR